MDDDNVFSAVNLLIQTNRMHKRLIDYNISSSIGLHRTQHIILMHLAAKESLPSQKELAKHLNITPAAVTGALKKLEIGGYIVRNIGNDNRFNEISITDYGKEVVKRSRELFSEIDRSIFENFSSEEISALIAYLKRMHNNLINKWDEEKINEKMV